MRHLLKRLCLWGMLMVFMFGGAFAVSNNSISIKFSLNSDIFLINGKKVTAVKPIVEKGTTLVPLRLISEAFGLKVEWNNTEKSATIINGTSKIKLYISRKEAYVDKKPIQLTLAPRIIKGKTMVPIRFISEKLGAQVSYDKKTKTASIIKYNTSTNVVKSSDKSTTVTKSSDKSTNVVKSSDKATNVTPVTDASTDIIKSNDESTSIVDYSSLLKSSTKEKVGDSYNDWSINMPKSMQLTTKKFDCSDLSFESTDGRSAFSIIVRTTKNDSLEYVLSEINNLVSGETLLKQGIFSNSSYKYASIIIKKEDNILEVRKIIKGKKIFTLSFATINTKDYLKNTEITNFLDSFDFKFDKLSGNTEDLSNVSSDGFRSYENERFKWSINIIADWTQIEADSDSNKNKENEVSFGSLDGSHMIISMYNKDDGLTLQKWIDEEKKYNSEKVNKERFQLLKDFSVTRNKKEFYTMKYRYKPGNDDLYFYEIFSVGSKYKYTVVVGMTEATFNNPNTLANIEKMINSFNFSESTLGEDYSFVEGNSKNSDYTFRKLSSDDFGWEISIPSTWLAHDKNNDQDFVAYVDPFGRMLFQLMSNNDLSYQDYIENYENSLLSPKKSSAEMKNISSENVKINGISAKKYVNQLVLAGEDFTEEYYVFSKNETLYTLSVAVRSSNTSNYFSGVVQKIIDSIQVS